MKKLIILLIVIIFIGCNNNEYNYQINKRKTPVVIIAMDTTVNSVVMRDGDNKIFTIYNNNTSKALSTSLNIGDTIRIKDFKYFKKNY